MYPPCIQPGVTVSPVMGEETYMVRIYRKESQAVSARRAGDASANRRRKGGCRRRAHDSIALAGTVENVEHGERRYFRGIEELWVILGAPPQPGPGWRAGKAATED